MFCSLCRISPCDYQGSHVESLYHLHDPLRKHLASPSCFLRNRDFVCKMCGKTFFSSASLAAHRVTHTQKENCEVLSLSFSDTSKNAGEKLFTCEVCGKGCSHRSALKHHMLIHMGERPYVCETCGKRCGHASALQNHMRIHTGKKPGEKPVCNVCGKKFRCMVNLKYHTSVHTGERPYACDQCDKRFSNPSNLKMHMMTHSEEKMHSCSICGRKFTQLYSLKLHSLKGCCQKKLYFLKT
uniref:C2H2-type domain-containing protein n=1 Tax=Maylandia zebra TaxID=106582 RepID=A0A3P9CBD4_9CICH